MGKQYEPGTVARVDVDYGDKGFNDELAIRVSNASFTGWTAANGATADDDQVRNIRPLVVLDPDNDLSIGPLRAALNRWVEWSSLTAEKAHIGNLLTLIERQVTPPKPAEPTGLGAVVRGRDGRVFVRVCSRHPGDDGYDWRADSALGSDSSNRAWRDIDAVEVLAEGHQSGWYDRGGVLQQGSTS